MCIVKPSERPLVREGGVMLSVYRSLSKQDDVSASGRGGMCLNSTGATANVCVRVSGCVLVCVRVSVCVLVCELVCVCVLVC